MPTAMPTASPSLRYKPKPVTGYAVGVSLTLVACATYSSTPGGSTGAETDTEASTTTEAIDDSTTRPGVMTSTMPDSSSTSGESASDSADVDETTDASSSTGPEGPVCGNGIVEDGETCDDGNLFDDDGCHNCEKDLKVFITSETYHGNKLEGLAGADARCAFLAAKAGLDNPLRFKAWLSTPTVSAASRLRHSAGRYVLVNGMPVAYGWDALTSEDLLLPITLDEKSQMVPVTLVWTGSHPNGEPVQDGSAFCNDWDYPSNFDLFGPEGRSMSQDAGWSYYETGWCGHNNRLYCFEN